MPGAQNKALNRCSVQGFNIEMTIPATTISLFPLGPHRTGLKGLLNLIKGHVSRFLTNCQLALGLFF